MDFHEPYEVHGQRRFWSRIWNFVPGGDYTWFVAGHPGSRIANDPLCEVGCPYAVRGFDFHYVGIVWLDDLAWRDGRWLVNPMAVEERGFRNLTASARREFQQRRGGPATMQVMERVTQAYRILFTRALHGIFAWIPDEETRLHVRRTLGE